MIDTQKLHMTIITVEMLMHIINDPYVYSVIPYTDRKELQCYSIETMCGERYKVFTRGKVL